MPGCAHSLPEDRMKTEKIYLKPGELFLSEKPSLVTTVLGSCVAVTMFSQKCKVAGICHALLPRSPSSGEAFRYVDTSIYYMLGKLQMLGAKKEEIEVKLFGGANVLDYSNERSSVGQSNVEAAISIIKAEKLTMIACDVGGNRGRKIVFDTCRGRILLKRIKGRPSW